MLYYFHWNVILLPIECYITSERNSRNFFGEVKKLPKRNQGTSQGKPRNFKKEIEEVQERSQGNSQSNLNFFAREGSLLRRGSLLISFGKSFGFASGRPLFCRGITIRLGAKSLYEKY